MNTLHNYMEDLVLRSISSLLPEFDCCTCDKCRNDIAAIALNNLPPQYFITSEDRALVKGNILSHQFNTNIISEVSKAITTVSQSPRHDL